ncbi:MAG TPA: Zn-dependent hydrolase, partial [Terriglobia bacterium]|nr:Zn-dependent hydrolase [Terriglobia bacterium]
MSNTPMLRYLIIMLVAVAATAPQSHPSDANALPPVAPDLGARLAKWKPVHMPFDKSHLTPREIEMVTKLAEASQDLDDIYWRQSDPEGLALYKRLRGNSNPLAQKICRLLVINGGRFDLIDGNSTFVGSEPFSPDAGLYPRGLTRQEIEHYVQKHPGQKAAIYSPYTIIRRRGNELTAVPYDE